MNTREAALNGKAADLTARIIVERAVHDKARGLAKFKSALRLSQMMSEAEELDVERALLRAYGVFCALSEVDPDDEDTWSAFEVWLASDDASDEED